MISREVPLGIKMSRRWLTHCRCQSPVPRISAHRTENELRQARLCSGNEFSKNSSKWKQDEYRFVRDFKVKNKLRANCPDGCSSRVPGCDWLDQIDFFGLNWLECSPPLA